MRIAICDGDSAEYEIIQSVLDAKGVSHYL